MIGVLILSLEVPRHATWGPYCCSCAWLIKNDEKFKKGYPESPLALLMASRWRSSLSRGGSECFLDVAISV
jgi:hypothetical protein